MVQVNPVYTGVVCEAAKHNFAEGLGRGQVGNEHGPTLLWDAQVSNVLNLRGKNRLLRKRKGKEKKLREGRERKEGKGRKGNKREERERNREREGKKERKK